MFVCAFYFVYKNFESKIQYSMNIMILGYWYNDFSSLSRVVVPNISGPTNTLRT